MEPLERFTLHQSIIEDFTSHWLAGIPTGLGRLAHVAMLRNVSSGIYHHPILEESYPERDVHEALLFCHEELFERALESRPDQKEQDLSAYFSDMTEPATTVAARWLEVEFFRLLVPFGTPPPVRDLFLSHLRTGLHHIASGRAGIPSAAS